MQFYTNNDAAEPVPTLRFRNGLRKCRRLLRGSSRQQALLLVGWILLLVLGFRATQYFIPTPVTHFLTCHSPRDRLAKSIPLPKEPSVVRLSQTWINLQSVFDAYPPHPLTLRQKKFGTGGEFPDVELIKNQTHISEEDARESRANHVEVTKQLVPFPVGLYSGRGIVMLAGGRYSGYASTGLGMLREIGCTLPVEVWMKDKEEEKPGWCEELRDEGMVCRRLSDYMDVSKLEHGYQLKINSILLSSFEQVLFLDGDNVPVRNPDGIFDSKSFTDTGVVLWSDYWRHSGAPILPYILGLTGEASEILIQEETKTIESGQLMWDKKRHWKALCLATYYNFYGPQHYYTLISQGWAGWGDKDTFPMALRSLRQEYYTVPHDLQTLFVNGTTHGIGMLQADPTNQTGYEPMFLHSNVVKWGVRAFLCVKCASDPIDAVALSALENPDSSIHQHLKEHHRIFKVEDMERLGIDPEPLIWKSMEHTACRSVWKDDGLCARTREHMQKTFGHQFRVGRIDALLGYRDRVCIFNQ